MAKSSIDKQSVINAYREAYMMAHGMEPSIMEKKGGWFVINDGASTWRLSSLMEMTETLRQRAREKGEESGEG